MRLARPPGAEAGNIRDGGATELVPARRPCNAYLMSRYRLRTDVLLLAALWMAAAASLLGCATFESGQSSDSTDQSAAPSTADSQSVMNEDRRTPPPAIRDWMDRLTVDHAYDPETGFIVAKEVVVLPPIIADAPPLDEAIAEAAADGRMIIVFATADRCAPCQQYKRDALNDPRVIERLADVSLLPTHVEVDRQSELAEAYLGGRGIPMTYALRDGAIVSTLRGQRTADDLLAWLEQISGA